MRLKLVSGAFGVLFGFMISWGHFTDPDEIQQMLLLEDLYLWKMFALAVGVAFIGTRLVRGRPARLVPGRISWTTARPTPRHIGGAAVFGVGWAVAASCPAPIAAQLAQGVWWSTFTFAGVGIGVLLYLRRQERTIVETLDVGPDTPAQPATPADADGGIRIGAAR